MNIEPFVDIKESKISPESIVFTKKVYLWCKLPYPGHPNGCPNFGKKKTCPPNVKYRADILIRYKEFTLVYAKFDINSYVNEFGKEHNDWTEKQLRNLLYWQPQLKKLLKNKITKKFFMMMFGAGSGFGKFPSMESVGIDVFSTLKNNGIEFDIKAKKFILMVSLLMSNRRKTL